MGNSLRKIMIVDHDLNFVNLVTASFRSELHMDVIPASSGRECLSQLGLDPQVILVDLMLPDMSGLELMKVLLSRGYRGLIIMLSSYGDNKSIQAAVEMGAYDFVRKPLKLDSLQQLVNSALEKYERQKFEEVPVWEGHLLAPEEFIGRSESISKLIEVIRDISQTDLTVLITGETGTGKDLVARMIHESGHRREKPFQKLSCASFGEQALNYEIFGGETPGWTGFEDRRKRGKLELAEGGTLLLDEIGEISPLVQSRLLRVFQQRTFEVVGADFSRQSNVRLVATSSRDLLEKVESGQFRKDLYYRLNVQISLPPLREHKDDLPVLAAYFLDRYNRKWNRRITSIAREALEQLTAYDWPGNVHELKNVIEQSVVLEHEETIKRFELPTAFPERTDSELLEPFGGLDFEKSLQEIKRTCVDELEKHYLGWVLAKYQGRIKQCSDHAGINRRNFYEKMKRFGLKKEMFKKK